MNEGESMQRRILSTERISVPIPTTPGAAPPLSGPLRLMQFDQVVDDLAQGLPATELLIGDIEVEFILDDGDDAYQVRRLRSQVRDELGAVGQLRDGLVHGDRDCVVEHLADLVPDTRHA